MANDLSLESKRIALVIQYQGTHFHGWQRQPKHRTVQAEIENALSQVLKRKVNLHGAGRTDAGVHGAGQIAHFDTTEFIPPEKWATILNQMLPDDLLIRASAEMPNHWHARFSACWRRYRYTLYVDRTPNLFLKPYSWHYYYDPLDETLIQQALDSLIGKHNLSAFRRANSDRTHSWVTVQDVCCYRNGPLIHLEIQADGFLYGMVRLLVGLLVEVGRGKLPIQTFQEIWRNNRRDLVKYSAPAQGLCFLRVGYPYFPFPESIWFDSQPLFLLPYSQYSNHE